MDSNKNYPVLSCGGSFTSNDHTNKDYKDGILRKNTPKAPSITYKTAEVYLSTEEFNNNFEISNYIIVNDGNDILKIFKPSVLGNIDFTSLAAVSNQFNMGLLTLIVSFLHNSSYYEIYDNCCFKSYINSFRGLNFLVLR